MSNAEHGGTPLFPGVQTVPGKSEVPSNEKKTASSSPPPKRGEGISIRLTSLLKMFVGLCFVGLATFAAMTEGSTVASNNAVMTAYTSTLRSPIEGIVTEIHPRVGQLVEVGSKVGQMEDDRLNDQRLVDLRAQVSRWRAEREAFEVQAAELQVISEILLRRVNTHALENQEYFMSMLRETEENRAAKAERAQVARREAERRRNLARNGHAPMADVDRLLAEAAALDRETMGLDARAAYIRRRAMSAGDSSLLDSGGNDVPYSRQRADEVLIRLTEVRRAISSYLSQEEEAQFRLNDEERRIALLRRANLLAPATGMVWRVSVTPGERVMRGVPVMDVVDCSDSFIVAAVAQDRFGDVRIGGRAIYRLSGEDIDRYAIVTAITGQASLADERNLAAAPLVQRSAVAMVYLRPEATEGVNDTSCAVGRTLRVLIPVTETGFMGRLTRFLD
jgi:multidrug resistance efflux pump